MHMLKKSPIFLVLVCIMLLISACGKGSSNTGGSTASVASLTPAQLLQRTATTMSHLKSVSYTMNSADAIVVPSSATSGSKSQTISTTIKANGVTVPPTDTKLQLSMNILNVNLNIAEIIKGQKVYVQNQKGKWYVIDKANSQISSFANTDIASYNKLLALKDAKITDDGITTLNGASVRHFTVTFGKDALKDLLDATGSLNSLPATQKQNLNKVLQSMTMKNTVLDTWIDNTTSYIRRFQLQFDMSMDMSKMVTPTPGKSSNSLQLNMNQNTTIDYSKFNAPVTITAPSNATPTSNILQAFQ
jgi:hypothetical protein